MSLQEGLTDSAIQRHTGISVRTMKRLRQQYRNNAFPSPPSAECGRPRVLNGIQLKVCTQICFRGSRLTNTQFLCDLISRQPDMSLAELKTEIFEVYGLDVSLPTVLRSLHRAGYTRKIVRFFFLSLCFSSNLT